MPQRYTLGVVDPPHLEGLVELQYVSVLQGRLLHGIVTSNKILVTSLSVLSLRHIYQFRPTTCQEDNPWIQTWDHSCRH